MVEGGGSVYTNLKAEMARFGVSNRDIHLAIGKSERSVRDKLSGGFGFSFDEALLIRDRFFTGLSLEYLFRRDEKEPAS